MTTFSEAVGWALANAGVRHAFGVVGAGNILAVTGLTAGGVRYLSARHEGGAMAMADAYYRATGEVAVCATTHGPGLTNAATGLAEAMKHRSGVLVLCGDAPRSGLRPNDIEQARFAAALGVEVVTLTGPMDAAVRAGQALWRARQTRRPVLLCLPNDLLLAEQPAPGHAPGPAPHRLRSGAEPVPHAGAELDRAVAALAGARRPLLLAGLGAWHSGAGKAICDLGDRIGALFATTVMAKGFFNSSQWSLGVCGGFASPRAASLIGDADVIVAFGASLDSFTLQGDRILSPDATLIQVDVADRPVARVNLHVTGDATAVALALLDGVNGHTPARSGWRTEAVDRIGSVGWECEAYEDASTTDRIDPRTLSLALGRMLPEERTVVLDGGHFIGWPSMYWAVPDPAGFVFMGSAFQAIGMGFAGAVGAATGRVDRTTVVALGDGGALMGLSELETLIRTAESALVVIYDDASYGYEVHMFGPLGADLRTTVFEDTDFAGIARSLGASAVTVRRTADLAAVRAWRRQGCRGVLVLDCKVVRNVVAKFLSDNVAARR